jgi:hypothetical protein
MSVYELAFQLKTPVYKIMDEMPYEELQGWYKFFRERPVGWREDNRAATMIQHISFGKTPPPDKLFASLGEMQAIAREKNVKVPVAFLHFLKTKASDGKDWDLNLE